VSLLAISYICPSISVFDLLSSFYHYGVGTREEDFEW